MIIYRAVMNFEKKSKYSALLKVCQNIKILNKYSIMYVILLIVYFKYSSNTISLN